MNNGFAVDNPWFYPFYSPSSYSMSTTETTPRTLAPNELPFTAPQAFKNFVTDTGKILPRKHTHLTARHQRAVTKAIKHARNNLLTT